MYWSTWPAVVPFNSKQDSRFVIKKDSPEAERSHWNPGKTWQASGGVSSFQQVPRNYSSVFLVLSSINGPRDQKEAAARCRLDRVRGVCTQPRYSEARLTFLFVPNDVRYLIFTSLFLFCVCVCLCACTCMCVKHVFVCVQVCMSLCRHVWVHACGGWKQRNHCYGLSEEGFFGNHETATWLPQDERE